MIKESAVIDKKWKESKLYVINKFIEDSKIMDDIDLLFIDTAPLHANAHGTRDLAEECKVWIGDSLLNELSDRTNSQDSLGVEFLETWVKIIVANQESTIAPFQHPSFTGILPIDEWSCWNINDNKLGEVSSEIEEKYFKLLEDCFNNAPINKGEYSEVNHYFTVKLGELKVPEIQDYYNKLQKEVFIHPELKQLMEDNKCQSFIDLAEVYNHADTSERQNISNLLRVDLDYRHYAMHEFIDKKFMHIIKSNNIIKNIEDLNSHSYSTLSGLPLWFHKEVDTEESIITNKLPFFYRGGIWFYALFSSKEKLESQRDNLRMILELSWLLYMDEYSSDAAVGKGESEQKNIQHVFGHEIQHLGRAVEKRWLVKFNELFEAVDSDTLRLLNFKYNQIFKIRTQFNPNDIALLNKSAICLVPDFLENAGQNIQMWSMTNCYQHEPFYDAHIAEGKISTFIENCYTTTLKNLETFVFKTKELYSFESANTVIAELEDIRVFYSMFRKLLKIDLTEDVLIQLHKNEIVWIGRSIRSIMKNCIQHGDWTREVRVVISHQVENTGYKFDIKIINYHRPNDFSFDYVRKFMITNQSFLDMEEGWQESNYDLLLTGLQSLDKSETGYKSMDVAQFCIEQANRKNTCNIDNFQSPEFHGVNISFSI